MALYRDKTTGATIDAFQLDEDCVKQQGALSVACKRGEWMIQLNPDGPRHVCDAAYFSATYSQVYPKPVDGDRVDAPEPVRSQDGPKSA